MTELEDIILTIDTREQNQVRIKAVENWFSGHGAIVEHSALKHCDYRLIGEFRGIPVNLGVEAKGWDNFLSDDIAEMEEKLLLATAEYEHVGFFVETQNYCFVPDGNNKHGKLNYTIPRLNRDLPAKTLAVFEGMLDTISKHPQIHVRQLRGEAQFPYSLYDLLVYIQNPHVIKLSKKVYKPYLLNLYMQIVGVGVARAAKLIENYPNPFWLCSASEESLKQVLGNATGQKAYDFIHCHDYETPEWKAGYHKDGTPVCDYADPMKRAECKTPDHFKHPCHVPESIPLGGSGTDTLQSLSTENPDGNAKGTKQGYDGTHDTIGGQSVKSQKQHVPADSSHAIDAIDSSPCSIADTHSSHPEAAILKNTTITPSASGDTKQGIPPIKTNNLSPADTDLSYLDEKTEYREVKPNKLDLKKPKMNLKETIKDFMQDMKQHTLQDIVDHCEGWTPGNVFEHVMGAVKSGYFKKVTEQDGRVITFQRII